jgi:ABC-type Co2+ transport system, periplasmic component
MKKFALLTIALILFMSHDLFFKLEQYFLPPNTETSIFLYNGTFDRSDNVIDRDRMLDVSVISDHTKRSLNTDAWYEDDETTVLNITTGTSGTYMAGVSTKGRTIRLEAADFNDYLVHDGVLDEIARRKNLGEENLDANELYSKHVKTIFQVGDIRTDDWAIKLDYPIEFVPLINPYAIELGDTLSLKLLLHGVPLVDQHVYAGYRTSEDLHDQEHSDHTQSSEIDLKTNDEGEVSFVVESAGAWFVRTIHMARIQGDTLTHESNWGTLTFGVSDEQHHHGSSKVSAFVWVLITIFLIAGLFYLRNKGRRK